MSGGFVNIIIFCWHPYRTTTLGIYFNICKSCQLASARAGEASELASGPANEYARDRDSGKFYSIQSQCNLELKPTQSRSFGGCVYAMVRHVCVCVCARAVHIVSAVAGCPLPGQSRRKRERERETAPASPQKKALRFITQ